ncbi:phosphate propanoyltransferase [Evansella caseinilytica]|uniref:Phosphate propanoyltransferase n=1 Tax=Evansella caseinilytica TaxID=1503961 RepID=A0A1H3HWM6_9BACI|nr:phosphate propanoyltransferase [Evansella caseinilytica]SDY19913.1 phosphate propanoyltransferase [Evansella caseinilytica]
MDEKTVKQLAEKIVDEIRSAIKIPIGISNRHLHLTRADFQLLFPHEELTMKKQLRQPGEFAAEQTVSIAGPKGVIENVRILGPFRNRSQLELAMTDARKIGLSLPLRLSGNVSGTPGVRIQSPHSDIELPEGAIIAQRHIHMSVQEAAFLGLEQGEAVAVKIRGEGRSLIFDDCIVRVGENMVLEMHLDTDEANAANVTQETFAAFIPKNEKSSAAAQ